MFFRLYFRFAIVLPLLFVLGLTQTGAQVGIQVAAQADDEEEESEVAPLAPAVDPKQDSRLPLQDLTGETLYQLLLGEVAHQRANSGIAAQTYLVLAKRTRDPRIARRAVEIATAARMPELALEAAKIWHESDPSSAQALQTVTVLLVSSRRVREAQPYLAKLLSAEGAGPAPALMQLGRLLAANPDKASNLGVVKQLVQPYPALAEAQFALAQAAFAARDEPLALEAIRRAAELRPQWEVPALYEAQILQRRSPRQAAERLAGFLAKFPDSNEVRMNYARALVGDKRLPEAQTELKRLLAAAPRDVELTYSVGLLAYQMKNYALSEASMKRLIDLGYRDSNSARYMLGQIAEGRKDWAGAIEWYRQIGSGERAIQARLRTAQALSKQGKIEEARSYLRNAAQADTALQPQFIIAEAQLLREANRNKEAFDILGEALKKTPDQPDLLYDIALTAEKIERFDLLENHLRKLIQLQPDHAHAHNALGYSFAERNVRLAEARKLIERAIELSPDDMFIVDSLGWVLYRMGDMKGAVDHLRRAYEARQDAEIAAHLGEVLWVSGQRQEAERIWKESLGNNLDSEVLQKTIKRFQH